MLRLWILISVIAMTAASPIDKRANLVCDAVDVALAVGILKGNNADSFCTSFLGVTPVSTTVTVHTTVDAHTTETMFATSTTTILAGTTTTAYYTYSFHFDNQIRTDTSTIAAGTFTLNYYPQRKHRRAQDLKRTVQEVKRTVVVERSLALPSYLKTIASSLISTGCSCIVTTSTVHVTTTAATTSTQIAAVTITSPATTTDVDQTVTSTSTVITTATATYTLADQGGGCYYQGDYSSSYLIVDSNPTDENSAAVEQCAQSCFEQSCESFFLESQGNDDIGSIDGVEQYLWEYTCYLSTNAFFQPGGLNCNQDPQDGWWAYNLADG